MNKIISVLISLGFSTLTVFAQSGTNSPYSQYGLGVLSDQTQGPNRAMSGLGIGLRSGNRVNVTNPASFSSVDSLTMIFDVGLSGQITNFEEGGVKRNANNANFEYAVAAFRLFPRIGLSAGVIPFTNIGYNYSNTRQIGNSTNKTTELHNGSGGVHQAFVGLGWNVFGNLSIGAMFSYMWGHYDKYISVKSSDPYVNTFTKNYGATVNSYNLNFGLQWEQAVGENNTVTLGLTYGLGHELNSEASVTVTNQNSQTGVSTDNTYSLANALSVPHTFGAGISWVKKDKFLVGFDYTKQKWGELDYPEFDDVAGAYVPRAGLLRDRDRFVLGGEWTPNAQSRNLLARIRYRAGVSYATPYVRINGFDGPKEYGVSAGFGIPVTNSWNSRSFLNISGQWVKSSSDMFINENMFRINIGLTFNESWFMKWKVN